MITIDGSIRSLTRRLLARGKSVKQFGFIGEELVRKLLRARGYKADRQRGHHAGDLRVVMPTGEIVRVEVKAARQGKQGTYHFCLYRALPSRICTDARHSDLLVLLCITPAGEIIPFILPTSATTQKQIAVTSNPVTYAGKLATYRQRLDRLELEAAL